MNSVVTTVNNFNVSKAARVIINGIVNPIINIEENCYADDADYDGSTEMTWVLIITIMENGIEQTQEYERYVDLNRGVNNPYIIVYQGQSDNEEDIEALNNPVLEPEYQQDFQDENDNRQNQFI